MKRWFLFAALAAGCATQSAPFTYRNNVLTTGEGRTLYVYAKDAPGKSNCNGRCADVWPPYFVTTDDGKAGGYFSDGGRRQWAFDGKPLYFNSTDSRPGDRKGGGADGVWSVVRSPATQSAPGTAPVGTPSMGTRYEGS